MDVEPTRPWWRKKRWIAAGLLGSPVLYLLSYGAIVYAYERGWLPDEVVTVVGIPYVPLFLAAEAAPPVEAALSPFADWCSDLGQRHADARRGPVIAVPLGPANPAAGGAAGTAAESAASGTDAGDAPR